LGISVDYIDFMVAKLVLVAVVAFIGGLLGFFNEKG
jgi:hypothetical protein